MEGSSCQKKKWKDPQKAKARKQDQKKIWEK